MMRQADQTGWINLAAGIPSNDILPFSALKAAQLRVLKREREAVFCYQSPEGHAGLRNTAAEHLSARGVDIGAGGLITTTGCSQALQLMLRLWVKPGDVVACEVPAYYGMLEILSSLGARVVSLPARLDDGLDPGRVEALFKTVRPVCLVVCPTLANPSGATIPDSDREALVALCRRHRVRILEDDIYADLHDKGAPKPLRAYDDGSTVAWVTSYSKSVAPGLRVGLVAPGRDYEACALLKCRQDMQSSRFSESVLAEFLRSPDHGRHLRRLRAFYADRRKLARRVIAEHFPEGTVCSDPAGGYMLWVRLPGRTDPEHLATAARQRRVVFCPGSIFYPGPAPRGWMRLNTAKAGVEELVDGLAELGRLAGRVRRA